MVRLDSVTLKGFRSFGDSENIVEFRKEVNFLVGENNVGKSSILRAINKVIKPGDTFREEEVHHGVPIENVRLTLTLTLEKSELNELINGLLGQTIDIHTSIEESIRQVKLSRTSSSYSIKFYELYFFEKNRDSGFLLPTLPAQPNLQDGTAFVMESLKKGSKLTAITSSKGVDPNKVGLIFRFDIFDFLLKLTDHKIKNFEEIRYRPEGKGQIIRESLDGIRVADVLDTLKSGDYSDRQKWIEIQSKFSELFPGLSLEIARIENKPTIMIVNKIQQFDSPINLVGAGIGQMIIFLTHLVASENMVFGLDMPELHFHPHAQRVLLNTINEFSKKNQMIIVTHSPTFVSTETLDNLIILRKTGPKTTIHRLRRNIFNENEKKRLRIDQPWNKELFFSRAVLAVEGPTEAGAFPIFAKFMDLDFDKLGVTVTCLYGKHFSTLMKTLREFSIPHLIVLDYDALSTIEHAIDLNGKQINVSPVVYQLYNLAIMKKDDIEFVSKYYSQSTNNSIDFDSSNHNQLNDVLRNYNIYVISSDFENCFKGNIPDSVIIDAKKISASKVIQGRFLAEATVDRAIIPAEIGEIIDIIKKKVSQNTVLK